MKKLIIVLVMFGLLTNDAMAYASARAGGFHGVRSSSVRVNTTPRVQPASHVQTVPSTKHRKLVTKEATTASASQSVSSGGMFSWLPWFLFFGGANNATASSTKK